jgi:hypothetical protein
MIVWANKMDMKATREKGGKEIKIQYGKKKGRKNYSACHL